MTRATRHLVSRIARRDGAVASGRRMVPDEVPVAFSFNGTTHAVMMASPGDLEDFAVGFALTEGIISNPGDIEEMSKIVARIDDRLLCINGMPTAEVYALAYKGLGITTYTSAIFNFIPKSAMAFHKAVIESDTAFTSRFMQEFFAPYGVIRSHQPGYAVSIVKAGADIVGRSAGKVRPPLSDLTREEHEALGALIALAGPQ